MVTIRTAPIRAMITIINGKMEMNEMRRNLSVNGGTRMKNPKIILIVPIIFMIIGLVIIFFAFKMKADNDDFMKTAVPVSAECTRVWVTSSTDDDGDTTYYYHADVDYEYDNIPYHAYDISVDRNTSEGDLIRLYINPDNPNDARQEYTQGEFISMAIFGGLFSFIGLLVIIILLNAFKKSKPRVNEPWEIR